MIAYKKSEFEKRKLAPIEVISNSDSYLEPSSLLLRTLAFFIFLWVAGSYEVVILEKIEHSVVFLGDSNLS